MNHPYHSDHQEATRAMPPGTPAWITQAMIDQTLAVWQPYYCTPLTTEDAVEMLIHVGHLFRALRKDAAPPR